MKLQGRWIDKRALPLLYSWIVLMALCTLCYWPGLCSWFQDDDFAWLHLRASIHSWHDLPTALFHPYAQGTSRFLSDRLYFLVVQALFGPNPVAFHAVGLITWWLAALFLMLSARRIYASNIAAIVAGVTWCCAPVAAIPLSWIATYNQVLLGFFFHLALYLVVVHLDTNRRVPLIGAYAALVLGFGASEIMVVFPAVAIVYAWSAQRRIPLRIAGLVVPSALFALVHFLITPASVDGPYKMHFDAALITTCGKYCRELAGAMKALQFHLCDRTVALSWLVFFVVALLAGIAWAVRHWRDNAHARFALWGLCWLVVALVPVLPLRDHYTDYYLYLPSAGLSFAFAAFGVVIAASRRRALIVAACLFFSMYAVLGLACGRASAKRLYARGALAQRIVLPIVEAARAQPGRSIFLSGLNSDQFLLTVLGWPFYPFGVDHVWLAPDERITMSDLKGRDDALNIFIASQSAYEAEVAIHHARTFRFENGEMREITAEALAALGEASRFVSSIQIGDADYARFLGAGWYESEGTSRWMMRHADLEMRVPAKPDTKLFLRLYCPKSIFDDGEPLQVRATVDGVALGAVKVPQANQVLEIAWDVPATLAGRAPVKVEFTLNRVKRFSNELRELGLVVSRVEIR